MHISFHRADVTTSIKGTSTLKHFIATKFKKITGRDITLRVILCSDEYLLNINKTYLMHDYYTDIITFPLSKTTYTEEAEIYISIDRVKENARTHNTSFCNEFNRVLFHGVIHLTGQKDKTPKEQEMMRKQENQWIDDFQSHNFIKN